MQRRIARHNRSAERPIFDFLDDLGANRIGQHVKTDARKRATFALVFTQNVVVGLMLEFMWFEQRPKLATQKFHGIELVTLPCHAHPDEVKVIGHQTIGRTPNIFTSRRMKQEFPKATVKQLI